MKPTGLPAPVLLLLRERLRSFEQLEVALFLRARSDQSWTAAQVSQEVHIATELVGEALAALVTSELVEHSEATYRYKPADESLASAMAQLVEIIREHRAAVMSQMSANAIERIRSGTLRAFADSFLLRRRKGDG